MRLAIETDIPRLQAVYDEAIEHAENVGRIDWPKPFPASTLQEYIDSHELFCFESYQTIVAAARLSRARNPNIWQEDGQAHFYLGKAATSSRVRSDRYFERTMLPRIITTLEEQDASIRLDCLADNHSLQNFYKRLGFVGLGNITFYSERQSEEITVTRMELARPS